MNSDTADQLRALSAKFRQNTFKLPGPEVAEAERLATEALTAGEEGRQLLFSLVSGLPAEAIAGALASCWRDWDDRQRQDAIGHLAKQVEPVKKRSLLQLSRAVVQIDAALARPLLIRACYLLAPRRDHSPNEKDQSLFRSVLLNKEMALLRFEFANATQAEAGALLSCVVAAEFAPARQRPQGTPTNAPRVLDWLWRQGLYGQLSSGQQQAVMSTAQSWPRETREEFTRRFETLPAEFASLVQAASTNLTAPTPESSAPNELRKDVTPEQTTTPISSASVTPDQQFPNVAPGRTPKPAARELLSQLGEALREILNNEERSREEARSQRVAAESARERAAAAERNLHRAEQAAREAQAQRDEERTQRLAADQEGEKTRSEVERLRSEIAAANARHSSEAEGLAARARIEAERGVVAFRNRLAEKLRPEWRDFEDVRNEPMSTDIGESHRRQVRAIFAALGREGITIEGQ